MFLIFSAVYLQSKIKIIMKNIHILPTDKPSRLFKLAGDLHLHKECGIDPKRNQDIYITSDEEIKKGDWVIQINYEKTNINLIKCVTEAQTKIANDKNGSFIKNKIILTTDQDLIKDGVQAIDDEFLEWLVNNPSCEEIEIFSQNVYSMGKWDIRHSIIIPKKETEQKLYTEEELENLIYYVCGEVARLQGIILNGNYIDFAYKKFKK